MKPLKFKDFLITEQKEYLAHKVADVLTSVHELIEAGKQLGAKQMVKQGEVIVNQMRRILHGNWPRSEHKYLRVLQKCGCALMKAIEEKGDLPDTFASVKSELEKLSGKLGEPVSHIADTEEKMKKPEPPPPGEQPQTGQPIQTAQDLPPQNMAQQTGGML